MSDNTKYLILIAGALVLGIGLVVYLANWQDECSAKGGTLVRDLFWVSCVAKR